MALLNLESLTLVTAEGPLLESASVTLTKGERVGLIGENGSGKSTLLRYLADPTDETSYYYPSAGTLTGSLLKDPEARILHMEQDHLDWSQLYPDFEEWMMELTIEELFSVEISNGKEAAEEDEHWRDLLVKAKKANLSWDLCGYETTPLGQLSPGSLRRFFLAIALFRPEIQLLLLDEPTNHLDLTSLLWFERQLIDEEGKTLIIISHDEAFLEDVVTNIWHLEKTTHHLESKRCSYQEYRYLEEMRREQQQKKYEAQEKRYQKLTAAAEKLKEKALKGAQYQSTDHDLFQRGFKRDRAGHSGKRASALKRLRDSGEKVSRLEAKESIKFNLQSVERLTHHSSIILTDLRFGFTTHLITEKISLRFDYGERIALLGPNGIGKSSFLKTILGQLLPLNGEARIGSALRYGNLTQLHESLPQSLTPQEYLVQVLHLMEDLLSARNILIRHGLSLAQSQMPIEQLNPGARVRLLLTIFILQKVNLLILDEPTNHLDQEATIELISALNSYTGTLIVISHDRHFLDQLELTHLYLLTSEKLSLIPSLKSYYEEIYERLRLFFPIFPR